MPKEIPDPSIAEIAIEMGKIRDYDSLMRFYALMPTIVDWIFTIGVIGFCYGLLVFLMGALSDKHN